MATKKIKKKKKLTRAKKKMRPNPALQPKKAKCIYLAAPFFNDAQVAMVQRMELELEAVGAPFFSPRLQPENRMDPRSDKTPQEAKAIFDSNVSAIKDCGYLLAAIDWPMPVGQELRACFDPGRKPGSPWTRLVEFVDNGVCWEMGAAFALEIPIVLFTQKEPELASVNVMIATCAKGILHGWTQFGDWLNRGDIALKEWRGKAT